MIRVLRSFISTETVDQIKHQNNRGLDDQHRHICLSFPCDSVVSTLALLFQQSVEFSLGCGPSVLLAGR